MNYRDHIKELFRTSQSLLQEYSALCIKMQESHIADPGVLQECDKKFKEYNSVISKHHALILEVNRRKIRLDEVVPAELL